MSFADREDEVFHFSVISDPLFSDKPNETSVQKGIIFPECEGLFSASLNAYLLLSKKEVFIKLLRPTIMHI